MPLTRTRMGQDADLAFKPSFSEEKLTCLYFFSLPTKDIKNYFLGGNCCCNPLPLKVFLPPSSRAHLQAHRYIVEVSSFFQAALQVAITASSLSSSESVQIIGIFHLHFLLLFFFFFFFVSFLIFLCPLKSHYSHNLFRQKTTIDCNIFQKLY